MSLFNFSRKPNVHQLRSSEDIDGLIEALSYENDHNIRLSAASALGKIGDPRAVEPLIDALEDQVIVKEVVALALGEIGDPQAVEPLINELENERWEVRGTAAKALGKIGDDRATKPLSQLLDDKIEIVRWNAVQALEALRNEAAADNMNRV